jgi:Protein of unknown function (DUF1569)
VLARLGRVRPDSQRRWGKMSSQQMICHLSDSFRSALGEGCSSPDTSLFKRTVLKWLALWVPIHWPHGFKTRPENDQMQGGTRPGEFADDMHQLLILFERYCSAQGEFAPHPLFGQMSRTERMRWCYLHMDHHLRQFGA